MAIPEAAMGKDKEEYGDYQLEGDKVVGKLNYISGFNDFETGAEGNFIALTVQEAKDGKKVTCKLTGEGASNTEKDLDRTGELVVKIHNTDNQLILKVENEEPRTITFTDCILLNKHSDVLKARVGTEQTWNKQVSELQEGISIDEKGKITGTLLWATDFKPTGYEDSPLSGNYIALHVVKEKLPAGASDANIKVGFDDKLQAPDPKDWNYTLTITNDKKEKKLKITFNDKVLYEYDLIGLTLKKNEIISLPKNKAEIKAQLDKLGISYDKDATKEDLLTLLPQKG